MADPKQAPGTPSPDTTSSPAAVVPVFRWIETSGPLYARDENGRIARVADPEPLDLPRPDVWVGRVWRDGEYIAVVCESDDGVTLSRYHVIEDDGLLTNAWEAISKWVTMRWRKERFG